MTLVRPLRDMGDTHTLQPCCWPFSNNSSGAIFLSFNTSMIASFNPSDENRGFTPPRNPTKEMFSLLLNTRSINLTYASIQSSTDILRRPSIIAISLPLCVSTCSAVFGCDVNFTLRYSSRPSDRKYRRDLLGPVQRSFAHRSVGSLFFEG
jgi:hypothetical protein